MNRIDYSSQILRLQQGLNDGTSQVAEVRSRIQDIFIGVMNDAPYECRKELVRLIIQLDVPGPLGDLVLRQDEVRTIKGSISQFSADGVSSACTSCAQCFLRRLLSKGVAYDFQKEEIDTIVIDGKRNYELLLGNAKVQQKELALAGIEIELYQSFSHTDSVELYDLETLSAVDGKHLELKEDSTVEFFEGELKLLEEMGNVGGVIHSQGKTFAVALLDRGNYWEYVLFDSHGSEPLNGTKEAFVTVTRSREKMAKILSVLCPYQKTVRNIPGEEPIPEEFALEMEAENNSYILYVVKHSSHEIIIESFDHSFDSSEDSSSEELDDESLSQEISSPAIQSPPKVTSSVDHQSTRIKALAMLAFLTVISMGFRYRKPIHKYLFTPTANPTIPPVKG